jgi:vitamin B12 transporter
MKQIFTLLILIITQQTVANAQTIVTGTAKTPKGTPLIGVSISLDSTYDGGITDSTGKFRFRTAEKGKFTLTAKSIGFSGMTKEIELNGQSVEIAFVLKEQIDELKAVTVTAGSFEAGDKKRAATVLNSLDVVTVGGANADITAAVKTLPGAQQVGESEGLFVRGGAGYETKQFIDGTVVNNPFFSSVPDIAQRGRFSPMLFKGTIFSTGGYSALYGQALSSALIMESIDLPERSSANISLSTVFVGAGIQQLSKDKKSSWGANYGYTNLKLYFELVKQKIDYFKIPAFHSADFNFRFKTKKGGMVKYYTSFESNALGIRRGDIDSAAIKDAFGLNNHNWYNNISWKENLGKGWKMNLAAGFSTNKDEIMSQLQNQQNVPQTFPGKPWLENKNFNLDSRQDLSQVRAVFEKRITGISALRFGSEYWYAYNKSKYNAYESKLEDHFKAAFAEADLYITNDLAIKAGARVENSSLINKTNFAPRLSMAYKTGRGAQVSIAYGEFFQKPENTQLIATTNLGYTKATHYIANYQRTADDRIFRVEAFYKKYEDLVKTYPSYSNKGGGDAKGVELFFRDKKTIKNFDYWVSYSYLDTKRDYLNFPTAMTPNFAAKHTASFVMKRFFTGIKTGFNFTYSYATGRPYYNLAMNNGKYEIADQGKTKEFHNLGFSCNYLTSIGKSFGVVVASVTNVLGQTQIYGYNYSHDGTNKVAVTPTAHRFFFIGYFISFGIDRTQDAINGNL